MVRIVPQVWIWSPRGYPLHSLAHAVLEGRTLCHQSAARAGWERQAGAQPPSNLHLCARCYERADLAG